MAIKIKNDYITNDIKFSECILKVLCENPNKYVSGQSLGKSLSLSRTSISKYIKKLIEDGYVIERKTKLGYKLVSLPDLIAPHEVEGNPDTTFIGKKVYYFKLVSSTNSIAQELAKNKAPNGTIVIAETQNQGKGRHGRDWISPRGGLWFSIIIRPNFPPHEASPITMVIAISIAQAIKALFDIEVLIKWPNDLFIENKKLGGILTEMSAEVDRINYLVVGIGININNQLPSAIANLSISLKKVLGKKIKRIELLNKILSCLEKNLLIMEQQKFSPFLAEAKKMCLVLNKKIKVTIGSEVIEGTCIDLDDSGNLILEQTDGIKRTIISGDIDFLRNE